MGGDEAVEGGLQQGGRTDCPRVLAAGLLGMELRRYQVTGKPPPLPGDSSSLTFPGFDDDGSAFK